MNKINYLISFLIMAVFLLTGTIIVHEIAYNDGFEFGKKYGYTVAESEFLIAEAKGLDTGKTYTIESLEGLGYVVLDEAFYDKIIEANKKIPKLEKTLQDASSVISILTKDDRDKLVNLAVLQADHIQELYILLSLTDKIKETDKLQSLHLAKLKELE